MFTLDIRFWLKPKIPLSEFPSLFDRYLDDWVYEGSGRDMPLSERENINKYQAYADHVNVDVNHIESLARYPAKTIPTEVLREMGIAIAIAKVPVYSYVDQAVIVRDK